MAAHADAAAAGPADIAGRQRDVHQRAVGAVVVVAPDQPFLVGEHRAPASAALLGLGDPFGGLPDLVDGEAGEARRLFEARLVAGDRLVEVLGRCRDERFIGPALFGDVGEPSVEQREIGAGIDREMHDAILAGFHLAGVDRHRAPRIDDDDAALFDRLGAELGLLLVHRGPAQIRNPVIEEVVGLGFQRVGADRDDGVGKLGVLVAVVELAHAHVARGMDFGVVGWAIVDADILHLHGAEIELAGAPSVLVAAAGAAVIEGGDEQAVLAHVVDHADSDAGDEIERVVPACRLHLPVAPDHGIGEALQLRVALARIAHLGDAGAAHRTETRIHHAIFVRLDDDVHVLAVLLDDVVHRGRVPSRGFRRLLLAEIDAEFVLIGRGAALLVGRPSVGMIAAADDAVVADDVEFLRILRDDRKPVDLSLVSHCFLPQRTLDSRPYKSSSTPSA